MRTTERINRHRNDSDALDFETLRTDAIKLVQELCGDNWTDYNLHDPGVTILEQLCYALTDLAYRSGFSIQDYLAGKNGVIDYEKQALYPPYDILPSSAITQLDYEKIIYDAIPEIDHIWLKPFQCGEDASIGLFTAYININQDLLQSRTEAVVEPGQIEKTTEQIIRLLEHLHRIYTVTDQITGSLEMRKNALNRWLQRVHPSLQNKASEQIELTDRLFAKIGEIVTRLEKQLSGLDSLRDELNAVQVILVNKACNLDEINQLDALLTKVMHYFNAPQPAVAFEHIYSILDQPIKRLADLVPILESIFPRLTAALNQTGVYLKESASSLTKAKKCLLTHYETGIKQKIQAVFSANRNLCEDINSIQLIDTKQIFLVGEIEIHPLHSAAKVYADIFFKCARLISSSIQIDPYSSVLAKNKNYEQVFSGPLTQHGFIQDDSVAFSRNATTMMDLVACVRQIDGVTQIRNLQLMDKNGQHYSSLNYQSLQSDFPGLRFSQVKCSARQLQLTLPHDAPEEALIRKAAFKDMGCKTEPGFFDEVHRELQKLIFENHAFRRNRQSFTQFIPLPTGQQRELNHYSSIQNNFPVIYGINKYGVPRSAPPETHAKIKQLKAYLFPFEQIMANYLQGLQDLPHFFSVDKEFRKTYSSQFLNNNKIPEIETLYIGSLVDKIAAVDSVIRQHDDFGTRKNRILDILLALYGEKYDQQSLLRYNFYRREDPECWLIESKINYLKNIRQISRDRGKGYNYLQPYKTSPENPDAYLSALHARISFLFGLNGVRASRFISDTLLSKKSRLVSDQMLEGKVKFISDKRQHVAVPVIPGFNSGKPAEISLLSRLPTFSYTIFKDGVALDNYRLVRSEQDETIVCFKSPKDSRLWILKKEATFDKAAAYAHQYCRTLRQLNVACENFHLIEHLLLRPRSMKRTNRENNDSTFFTSYISVIFPSWTARFSNSDFRRYAKETIQKNLPAHILADFYWLNFDNMQKFEQCYKTWLSTMQQLNQPDNDAFLSQLNEASENLIEFLMRHKQENRREYWL